MKKEVLSKWIEALRSGDYTRGEGYLCRTDDDGDELHCCLGVLCELAIKDGVKITKAYRDEDETIVSFNDYQDFLPEEVATWAGLPHKNPSVEHLSGGDFEDFELTEPLSDLNDQGYSFQQIAEILETNWKTLS